MTLALLLLILAGKPAPKWETFADCAAAYQVNAAVKDPSRSATMSGDMAQTGADYLKAALQRRKDESAVRARVKAQTPRFAAMSREKLDKFIDACPQVED
jgi:hypothetical protein